MKNFDYTSKKSESSNSSYTSKSSILSTLAWGNRDLAKTVVVTNITGRLASHVEDNLEYYKDVIRYTFFNSIDPGDKRYPTLHFSDLPPKVLTQINKIQKTYLQQHTVDGLFELLNIPKTSTNKFSPLQGKYVYHYKKTYNTLKYCEENDVSDDLLLAPFNDVDRKEYLAWLG